MLQILCTKSKHHLERKPAKRVQLPFHQNQLLYQERTDTGDFPWWGIFPVWSRFFEFLSTSDSVGWATGRPSSQESGICSNYPTRPGPKQNNLKTEVLLKKTEYVCTEDAPARPHLLLLLLLQHPFNSLFAKTTWVSRHWILLEQQMMGWQWHQLDHMQLTCISLQTDNHVSTSPLSFYRPDALPAIQLTASKHWRQTTVTNMK